jgi:hypothetical protein
MTVQDFCIMSTTTTKRGMIVHMNKTARPGRFTTYSPCGLIGPFSAPVHDLRMVIFEL